jgi:hypothetical protein
MDPIETTLLFNSINSELLNLKPNQSAQPYLDLLSEYLTIYKDKETHETISKPLVSDKIEQNVSAELAQYLTKIYDTLAFDGLQSMVLLSNYLCCEPLLNACCAEIACVIKAQTLDELARENKEN